MPYLQQSTRSFSTENRCAAGYIRARRWILITSRAYEKALVNDPAETCHKRWFKPSLGKIA